MGLKSVLGLAFLEKTLFTTYVYSITDDDEGDPPVFQISLASLLETLQIFGVNDIRDRSNYRDFPYGGVSSTLSGGGRNPAFDTRNLGMIGSCHLSYNSIGDPLCIILKEAAVITTCELVTYEPDFIDEISLQKDALTLKIIMRASLLHDAIIELSSTSPARLNIIASPTAPHFTLSSSGPLGSATVEFDKNPDLLETFQVPQRTVNSYKYAHIKAASRAMAIASKVSIRGDEQGVLSLQFLIEVEGGVSFVDFRFIPFELEEGDDEEAEDELANANDVE